MSEQFGEAFVIIRPQVGTLFKTELRRDVLTAIKEVGPFTVKVIPIASKVSLEELRKTIKSVAAVPVPVILKPDIKAFRIAIENAKVPPKTVRVLPDTKLFNTRMAELAAKAKTITVPLVSVPGAAAIPKGGGITRAAVPQLTAEEKALERFDAQISLAEAHTKRFNELLNAPVGETKAAALEREAAAAQHATAALSALAKAENETVIASQTASEANVASLRQQISSRKENINSTLKQKAIQDANQKVNDAQIASTQALVGVENLNVQSLKSVDVISDKIILTKKALIAVNEQLAASEEASALGIDVDTTALEKQQVALEAQLVSLRRQRTAVALSSKEQAAALRGFGATGLAAGGLRGATLAASFPFLAGAAAATGLLKAVQAAKQFQTQLALVAAVTGADREEITRISDAAIKLGKDLRIPLTSAVDAEQAIAGLARAGFTLEQSLRGARGVLLLTAAGETTVAESTKVVAQTIRSFSLSTKDATRVADTLTNASLASQASLQDVATALGNVGAPAGRLGLSLNATTALLVQLAKGGLNASDAGTVLRTALLRLVVPTGKAQKELEHLNLSLRDSQGRLRPDIFIRIGDALQGLTRRARDAALGVIFSQRGIRAGQILVSQGLQGLIAAQQQVGKSGSTFEEASARAATLSGHMTELKKTLSDAGTAIATPLIPQVNALIDSIGKLISLIPRAISGLDSLTRIPVAGFARQQAGGNLGSIATGLLGFVAARRAIASFAGTQQGIFARSVGNVASFGAFFTSLIRGKTAAKEATTAVEGLSVGIKDGAAAAAAGSGRMSILAGGLTSLVSPATAAAVGIGLLAGGIYLLATRESALDRANKNLKKSTQDLTDALEQQHQSVTDLARARIASDEAFIGREQARARQQTAQKALATSTAPAGSNERITLLTNLRLATDAARTAQLDYNDALREENRLIAAQPAASKAVRDSRKRDADALRQEFAAIPSAISHNLRTSFAERVIPGFDLKVIAADTKALRDLANAQAATETTSGLESARRERVIAGIESVTGKRATNLELKLLVNAKSAQEFTQKISEIFGITGKQASTNFLTSALAQIGAISGPIAKIRRELGDAISEKRFLHILLESKSLNDLKLKLQDIFGREYLIKLGIRPDALQVFDPIFLALVNLSKATGEKSGQVFVQSFADQLTALDQKLTAVIFQGGGLGAQNAVLQQRLAADRARVAKLEAGGTPRPGSKRAQALAAAIAKAEADANATQSTIASNQQTLASQAAAAASKADAAILKRQQEEEQRQQNRISLVQRTATFRDDIRQNQILLKLFEKHLVALRARLAILKKNGADITAIQAAIDTETQNIFNLQNITLPDLKKQQQAFIQSQRDALAAHLDAQITIAATTASVADDRRAINAKKRFDEAQIARINDIKHRRKLTQDETAQLDAYRVDLAQQQEALRNLTNQAKGRSFAQDTFAFLQTQTGFVSNLLGNLIPSGATGLVGQGTQHGGVGQPPPPQAAGSNVASQIAALTGLTEAKTFRGVSSGQAERQNNILLKILAELHRLNRGTEHPEAKKQRHTGSAAMDYHPFGVSGMA